MFSTDIDKIWHAHILNTRRYEQFCTKLFGRIIHHAPNLDVNTTVQRAFTYDCVEPEPSCKEPDPGPSCREPDPNPSCKEGLLSLSNFPNSAEWFHNAYISAYNEPPGNVWNLPISDGFATS